MIAAIKGRLVGRQADSLLLDIGPLVLQVHTSATTIADLAPDADAGGGSEIRLHTYLHVREDQLALYGFGTPAELALFNVLIGVMGIGPRVAANILGATRPEPLLNAIAAEDVAFLSRLPGIGKKTAARIILDLRGKLADLGGGGGAGVAPGVAPAPIDGEVIEALQALGYTAAEAHTAVGRLPRDGAGSVEERIVAALRAMSEG
ncbi:MAG: RuvA [uncultured Thermomicrobiales bacterium]|uniref:Holliday junction branch migration complex subunit RuvA n=1 Tax=uncultured Thermomicrobiales bacterium TaxID=1645740 RepID=A0A6J4VS03_9BACT|nr:MAG: RuvA [uncultured Thermomicrobiales bacterium]